MNLQKLVKENRENQGGLSTIFSNEVKFPSVITTPISILKSKNASESPNKKARLHKNLSLALGSVLQEKSQNYYQM